MHTKHLAFILLAACSHSTPTPEDPVKRGEQLVILGGCGDCHTPKTFDPQAHVPVPDYSHLLAGHPSGAPEPEAAPGAHDMAVIGPTFTSFKVAFGTVYARNLTPDRETGLGAWTPEEFIQTMRTGHRRGSGRALLPPMPWQNLAAASDTDLRAMFAYLQSIPAVANHVPDPKVPAEMLAIGGGK